MILPDRGRRPHGRRCRGINRHRHDSPAMAGPDHAPLGVL